MGEGPHSAHQGARTGRSAPRLCQDPSLLRTNLTDTVLGEGSQERLSVVQGHGTQPGRWKSREGSWAGVWGPGLGEGAGQGSGGGGIVFVREVQRIFSGELGKPRGRVKGGIQ